MPAGHKKLHSRRRTYAAAMSAAIAQITRNGDELVEFAVGVLRDPGEETKYRAWAAEYLTDRLAGKAPAVVESEVTATLTDGRAPEQLTDEELADELARLSAPHSLLEEGDDAEVVEGDESDEPAEAEVGP